MDRLLHILLGIKPAPWTAGGSWRLEWLSLPHHDRMLMMLVGIGVAIWGVLFLYRREGRNLNLPTRIGMTALRMAVLLGVVAMLLEPVMVFTKQEMEPSNLLVLVDRSESMELRDAYVDPGRAAKLAQGLNLAKGTQELRDTTRLKLTEKALDASLKEKLAAGGDRVVKVQGFTSELLPETSQTDAKSQATTRTASTMPTTQQSTIDASSTAIGTSIRQAIAAYRGQPLAGILLVTDGQSNAGELPSKAADFAAGEGVPIVSLAMGTPQGPRNAKLTKLEVNPVVFVRDPNQLHVMIESRGLANSPATLVLEKRKDGGPWEEAGRQSIVLEEEGQMQSVPFDFKEDQPAKLEFRATLQDVGPELTTDDNVATAEVRAIRQKIRVLFIAGSTFPEVEFIRNAILRDNQLSASTWLQTADKTYVQPGNPVLKRLPETPEELNDFDCIIMYDPDPALWPENYPQMISDFIGKAGGGLVYVAGERMTKTLFDHPDDPAYAWVNLLPVVVDPGLYQSDVSVRLSSQEPWRLDITPEGKIDPIFQFSTRTEDNDQILNNLPGMYWHFPVTRGKPGATVLARHGDPRMRNEHGPHVLLATQLVGPGRTIFVGFDSTYRWRYLDEAYFDGFWARMIDRAGRAKQLGGRYPYTITTDRASYRPQSQVTITAHFDNASDRDAGLSEMHGEIEVPDQPAEPITLTQRAGDPNTFEATFTATHPGLHFLRVWTGSDDLKQVVRAATLQFPVELPNLEYDRPTLDQPTLEALAKQTGGQVFALEDADKIPSAFHVRRVARMLEDRQEIWNAPGLFGGVLLVLFLEWVLRKKFRMV